MEESSSVRGGSSGSGNRFDNAVWLLRQVRYMLERVEGSDSFNEEMRENLLKLESDCSRQVDKLGLDSTRISASDGAL